MSATDDSGNARRGLTGWLGRLRGPFTGGDAPAGSEALRGGEPWEAATTGGAAMTDGALLDAVVSGLPDPVVVLEQDGRVISFNAGAAALAPALRRGDLASIALRMPELIEAIRAARSTGKPQRIEFSARIPSVRWWEAFVAPVPLADRGVVVITVHDLTPIHRVEAMRADFKLWGDVIREAKITLAS